MKEDENVVAELDIFLLRREKIAAHRALHIGVRCCSTRHPRQFFRIVGEREREHRSLSDFLSFHPNTFSLIIFPRFSSFRHRFSF
ncbi:hypothetical protein P8452_20903 [Trifolium repens]|nr:hypothetical protein P8452_20903 [Trifolium repens]